MNAAKPLNENIREVRIIDENNDLRPLLDVAGEKFAELIKAVSSTNKAGTLTLKIDVKPSTAGALAVKGDCNAKMPKGMPAESLLWATPDGNLLSEDPKQIRLPLRAAEAPAAPTELKQAAG